MKIAVITGCNRGLGEGIKKVLLNRGYFVYGINRTKSKIIDKNYKEIICDMKNIEDIKKSVFKLPDKIDLLVLNAAVRVFSRVVCFDDDEWKDAVDINLNGPFYLVKGCIDKLKMAKGDIVFVGSHSSKYTFEKGSSYCATKAAIRNVALCLQDELRYDDIRVIYLSLGSIKNRDHHIYEEWKLYPEEVGQAIYNVISLPKKIYIPYLDIRPLKPLKMSIEGIDKLQYV